MDDNKGDVVRARHTRTNRLDTYLDIQKTINHANSRYKFYVFVFLHYNLVFTAQKGTVKQGRMLSFYNYKE